MGRVEHLSFNLTFLKSYRHFVISNYSKPNLFELVSWQGCGWIDGKCVKANTMIYDYCFEIDSLLSSVTEPGLSRLCLIQNFASFQA